MIIPVTLGALIAIIAFLPLALSIKLSKKVTPTSNLGYGAISLIGVFVSMVVLAVAVLVCYFCFRDFIIPFALACAITLFLLALVFGIYVSLTRDKFAKSRKDGFNDNANVHTNENTSQKVQDSKPE